MSTATQRTRMRWASRPLAESLGQAIPVRSASVEGHDYQVLIGPEGDATCTCTDYERRRHDCKHILEAKEKMTTAVSTIRVQQPPAVLPTKDELESMDMVAARLYASNAVALPDNLKTPQDVAAVILAGWELGVKPGTAIRHIAVIKGKAEPDGQLMAGIVTSREPDASFEIVKDDGKQVTVRFRRPRKGYDVEYTYSLEDAKVAGLTGGVNWQKFPRDMMRWAAIKRLCRTYANDLINGITSTVYGELPDTLSPAPEPDEQWIEGNARLIDADDLYSEGDEPEEAPAMITDAQRKRLVALWDPKAPAAATLRQRFPQVFPQPSPGASNRISDLTADEADEVITILEASKQETPEGEISAAALSDPTTSPAASPDHSHDYKWNDDKALIACVECGDPDPAQFELPLGSVDDGGAKG